MKTKYFEDETGDGCKGITTRYCFGCMDYDCPANPDFDDENTEKNEGEQNERN